MKRTWIFVLLLLPFWLNAQEQLDNMNFDQWSKVKGTWYPSSGKGESVWSTSNPGTSILRINSTIPEYEHVAVAGSGKAAAKIVSRKLVWAFLTGNLFTGEFVRVVKFSGAEMYNGVPFHSRPKSLSGYYHYRPSTIDFADDAHASLKGQRDQGQIEIALYCWKQRQHFISNDGPSIPATQDPALIGHARLTLKEDSGGYVPFELKIDYRSDATPTYVYISALSSRMGEFFTGSSGSILYLDELQFNY